MLLQQLMKIVIDAAFISYNAVCSVVIRRSQDDCTLHCIVARAYRRTRQSLLDFSLSLSLPPFVYPNPGFIPKASQDPFCYRTQ